MPYYFEHRVYIYFFFSSVILESHLIIIYCRNCSCKINVRTFSLRNRNYENGFFDDSIEQDTIDVERIFLPSFHAFIERSFKKYVSHVAGCILSVIRTVQKVDDLTFLLRNARDSLIFIVEMIII